MTTNEVHHTSHSKVALVVVVAAVLIGAVVYGSIHFGSGTATTRTTASANGRGTCSIPSTYNDDWLTFKHDPQRTGYSNYNFSSSAGGKFLGQLVWQNENISATYEMASTSDKVFASNYYLTALNASNGETLWSVATGFGPFPPISSDGNRVYLGSNLGGFDAFNPVTGNSTSVSTQVMAQGYAAICGDSAYVTSTPDLLSPNPSPTGSMLDINLTTGATIWGANLSSAQFQGFPTTDGRLVYSTLTNQTVAAFVADSGHLAWKRVLSQSLAGSPSLMDGTLFVLTAGGYVYALNATNGSEVWAANLGQPANGIDSPTSVGYGMVFVPTSGGLIAVNSTNGSVIWRNELDGQPLGTPTVVDGFVFVEDEGATLYQVEANNGTLLWHFTLGSEGVGGQEPIVANGLVIAGSSNGIFAFR